MPHCFIHMSSRVRTYFWAAGADSTMDVAGWWASSGEVRADGHRLGWSEADVEAATFAWLEARRPAVQLLPNVPVPVVPHQSEIPTSSTRAPLSGTTLSCEELVPTDVSPHPDAERYRPHLRKMVHSGLRHRDEDSDCVLRQSEDVRAARWNVNMAVYDVLFSISSIYVVPTMSAFVVGPSTSILCGWIGMRIAVSRVSGPRTSAGESLGRLRGGNARAWRVARLCF